MNQGTKRTLIPAAFADLRTWVAPDVSVLDGPVQANYANRKQAVEMYAAGESYLLIKEKTGFSDDEVRRLVKRCVTLSENGHIFGFSALLYGFRVKSYDRKCKVYHLKGGGPGGCAGALEQLFGHFPEVRELVHDLFLNQGTHKKIHESRTSLESIHNQFKSKLRDLGFTDYDWPFNTTNCGYKTICEYCRALEVSRKNRSVLARAGKEAVRRGSVGTGHRCLIPVLRSYSLMQMDYYKVDSASVIVIKNDVGDEVEIPVARWHVGFLVELKSSAICGAYIALERTPSGDSALEVIDSALRAKEYCQDDPRSKLTEDGKALIVQLIPELEFQCFAGLMVDNGWANAAHEVVNNIMDMIGCAVNFGPCYAWWRRDLVENVIGQLTRRGLQRLPSTHGCGPNDTRIDNPNLIAIKFRITISDLISVVYGCIRDHNESRLTEKLQFTAPLSALRIAMQNPASGFIYQPLPLAVQQDPKLLAHVEEVTVRGNLKKNVRPFFVLDRCRYTNDSLAFSFWLIGKKLVTYTDRRRCRIVFATVKETGDQLGQMMPGGSWKYSDCSWRDRKHINRSGLGKRNSGIRADPVQKIIEEKAQRLSKRPRKQRNKSSGEALKLAKLVSQNSSSDARSDEVESDADASLPTHSVPRKDPFGLNDVPKMKPIGRRG